MTSKALDDFLARLAYELARRGGLDPRILAEAREHLVDAIEDGQRRGLTYDAAAREAFERFGSPETIAADAITKRFETMANQWIGGVRMVWGTVWKRKWWILVPTMLTAIVTSITSYYFLPIRYQSVSSLLVVPPRVPAEYVHYPAGDPAATNWLKISSQATLSQTRLERLIHDFDLYKKEIETESVGDLVRQMRRNIDVRIVETADRNSEDVRAFNVSFMSADPKTAMRVTERLTSLFVEDNLRDREVLTEGTSQFLESQIEDTARDIRAYEDKLETLRVRNGGRPLSQADVLPYEVLKDRYKTLLGKAHEARLAANMEHRQIGRQLKVIDPARLPDRPVGPSRIVVNVAGALAGLAIGLVFVSASSRRRRADRSVAGDE